MPNNKTVLELAIQHLKDTNDTNEARKTSAVFGYESQCLLTGDQTKALLDHLEAYEVQLSKRSR